MNAYFNGQPIFGPGPQGEPGADATINGQNTLEIVAGENIAIDQQGKKLTISSSGGGSAGEVYSTEETRIGTWIDGKPLYRKVFECSGIPSTDEWNAIPESTIPEIDYVINIFGQMKFSNSSYMRIPYGEGYSFFDMTYEDSITVFTNYNAMINTPFTVVLEYTKTTD